MYTLSIIVPVYKVEKYLTECLDSLVCQLTPEVELLLIDDGSPDRCGAICDQYASKYSNIRVIHQENSGVSVVRNTGIEQARGRWITFVDGDDFVPEHAIGTMLKESHDETVDLVVFQYANYCNGQLSSPSNSSCLDVYLETETDLMDYRRSILSKASFPEKKFEGLPTVSPWAKLLRASFLRQHGLRSIPGVKMGQDLLFSLEYTKYLKKVHIVPAIVYFYRQNEGSVTVRYSANILDLLDRIWMEASRILSEQQDQRLGEFYYDYVFRNVETLFLLGAYHQNCPWKSKERIQWLRKVRANPYLNLAIDSLRQEDMVRHGKWLLQFAHCKTSADFYRMDVRMCWRYRFKPAIKRRFPSLYKRLAAIKAQFH